MHASEFIELEDLLASALRAAKAGHVDGNEVGDDSWTIFMFGKSADALFDAIHPVLESCPHSEGATVVKQFGGPNAEARTRVLWRGRFRVARRARKPGRRPRVGDVLEFDCEGGVGFGHATCRETSAGMRGMWVVALLSGVHEPGSRPDLGKEICRIWLPLGAAISQGLMRVVGNEAPASHEMPPSILSVSFDFVRACVEHGRSLYDEEFLDALFEQES
ncbi:MAG TPA: hypothetical protein VFZ65_22345 [Planctomycetota bacterium]|nr:hypothetical protein [Planctomycetota bacterium]